MMKVMLFFILHPFSWWRMLVWSTWHSGFDPRLA